MPSLAAYLQKCLNQLMSLNKPNADINQRFVMQLRQTNNARQQHKQRDHTTKNETKESG